jgi:hypothetical protein
MFQTLKTYDGPEILMIAAACTFVVVSFAYLLP